MNSELLAHGDVEPTLGVARHSGSTTFRVFSQHATALWLCLFDGPDGRESDRVPMARKASGVWETTLGGVAPGQLYGFRAEGPYALETGHRFNPAKLLFDPYARSYRGSVTYHRSLEDHPPWSPHGSEDSAPFVPKAEVLDLIFDWEGDRAPAVPWQETVVYEAHVKGLTALH
ncbi:MAG: glycogen debranching enzyme, partial [Acidobacteria bacterium]|nr:glycogen debranching enzyme [Acidobacteriota bacterium]